VGASDTKTEQVVTLVSSPTRFFWQTHRSPRYSWWRGRIGALHLSAPRLRTKNAHCKPESQSLIARVEDAFRRPSGRPNWI